MNDVLGFRQLDAQHVGVGGRARFQHVGRGACQIPVDELCRRCITHVPVGGNKGEGKGNKNKKQETTDLK